MSGGGRYMKIRLTQPNCVELVLRLSLAIRLVLVLNAFYFNFNFGSNRFRYQTNLMAVRSGTAGVALRCILSRLFAFIVKYLVNISRRFLGKTSGTTIVCKYCQAQP